MLQETTEMKLTCLNLLNSVENVTFQRFVQRSVRQSTQTMCKFTHTVDDRYRFNNEKNKEV